MIKEKKKHFQEFLNISCGSQFHAFFFSMKDDLVIKFSQRLGSADKTLVKKPVTHRQIDIFRI